MRLGPYDVVQEVGRGGLGVVFRARAPSGADVAIKVLRHRAPQLLARFARERQLLASLGEAQGFVPLLDAGEDPTHGPYLVMPFLGGGTLRDRLRGGPLSTAEAIALGLELAGTMARAHALGIVHRDLKPENVLFAAYGRALIGDLGAAKLLELSPGAGASPAALSRTGEVRGTLGYMAPEQTSNAKHVGPTADVFALGAILYECLAGQPAFASEHPLLALDRVVQHKPLAALVPGAPAWLVRTVERCLAPEPTSRPADAAALARALVHHEAEPASRSVPPWLVPAVVLVVGGLVALGVLLRRDRGAPDVAASPAPASSAGLAKEPPADATTLAARAIQLHGEGDLPAAREAADRALELDPRNLDALHVRGLVRYRQRDLDGAFADAVAFIELAPSDHRGWLTRGVVRNAKGDLSNALSDFDEGVRLAPMVAQVWSNRAATLSHMGRFQDAIDDATRAIELDPRDWLAWANRAAALVNLGRPAEAIDDATRAIEIEARQQIAYSTRGAALNNLREYPRALEDLTRAIELDPTEPRHLAHRSYAYVGLGRFAEAERDATRAIELAPNGPDGWLRRGTARSRRGDHKGAIADYDRAIELNNGDASSLGDRGIAKERAGDLAGARADYELALERCPPGAHWKVMISERLARLRGR